MTVHEATSMNEGNKMSSLDTDLMPVFTAMLRSALGDWMEESPNFPAMLAENVEIEHPYAPEGSRRMVGRDTLIAHLRETKQKFTIEHAQARHVYRSEERRAVIVEFDLAGQWVQSGTAYEQQCVAIIETDGGRITRYREYWNPRAPGMPEVRL
jgi:uncharacterized protein